MTEYNWDTIDVGRPELNSSQNFFSKRHILHEKLEKQNEQASKIQHQKPFKPVLKKKIEQKVVAPNSVTTNTDKENVSVNCKAIIAISMVTKPAASFSSKPSLLKSVLKKSESVSQKPLSTVQVKQKQQTSNHSNKIEEKKKSQTAMNPKNLVSKANNIGQRQFDYAEKIHKHKEELARKLKEQEDKELKFNFHANPAPKFKKVRLAHKQTSVDEKKISKGPQMTKQNSLPQISMLRVHKMENIVPSCGDPDRLKFMNEKKKRLLQKYQETQIQFKAKPADVLKKQPFQPVHNHVKTVSAKPFKLQLTERLLIRSEFDKKLTESNAIRKKQEETRQRMQDLQFRKVMRQKTEFRARANPFSNQH